jgi:hypothetical protein
MYVQYGFLYLELTRQNLTVFIMMQQIFPFRYEEKNNMTKGKRTSQKTNRRKRITMDFR